MIIVDDNNNSHSQQERRMQKSLPTSTHVVQQYRLAGSERNKIDENIAYVVVA
jgi:hypothetical protein